MFIKKWRWKLAGKNQRVSIRVFGANKKKPLTFQAILDTGSSNCVFSQDDFQTLFEGESLTGAQPVRGIGGAMEISRRVSIELYSHNGELIEEITNVSASFILDRVELNPKTGKSEVIPFDEALFGVSNAMDRFKWVLDYPEGEMTLSKP
jgi:hypothetical protein